MSDLFTFYQEETEDIFHTPDGEGMICKFDDTADELHSAVVDLQEVTAITGPAGAQISIYPTSMDEPTPVIVVNDGQGLVLMGGELQWPDDKLAAMEFACELLSAIVNQANDLLLTLRARTHPPATPSTDDGPALDYVYVGEALPVTPEHLTSECETITGAFRLLCWLPTRGAIVGNGESPEKLWATLHNPERA